jgi:hypothetical protein
MANLVLIARAERESEYSATHIRYLLRHGLVKGHKEGGTWLVDLDDLERYERRMKDLGTKKHDPTRDQDSSWFDSLAKYD